jgi:UDP-2,4-diacetamido-2,4,6-trideoxy-beta-L-altropyranose hydrolase
MSKQIAFRAAASPSIGGGHVVRSVAIANALRAAGAACTFFVNEDAMKAVPLLAQSGHGLIATPQDNEAAVALAKTQTRFDWLVVDDYSLAAAQEIPWRAVAKNILVVDDLADRVHDCDMLLDSNPGRGTQDYSRLVPAAARLLLGGAYAPLRAEFALSRATALARRAATTRPERLLVSFGLVDPGGITAQAVSAVAAALPGLAMDVVLGPFSQSRAKIEAAAYPQVTLHVAPPSMSDLMIASDIALGAGGSTAWERACLGLPAIAVVLAENQRGFAHDLATRGVLFAVEETPDLWKTVVRDLSVLIDDKSVWQKMSRAAATACDGLGAQHIVQAMLTP